MWVTSLNCKFSISAAVQGGRPIFSAVKVSLRVARKEMKTLSNCVWWCAPIRHENVVRIISFKFQVML